MRRFHLFELEDQQWFPAFIRNYGTDFLQMVANKFDFYKGIVPILKKGLEKSGGSQVIDLASGGGGGWIKLSGHLKKEVPGLKVLLTDFYPNRDAFEYTKTKDPETFEFETGSVNALDVPKSLKGLRTQFLSFHHFKPDDAKKILQNAVDCGEPIAIFEGQKRDFIHLIKFAFSPLNVIFMTPFIRPFKFWRIVFTYLIPIVPLFVLWDGLVSVLRTYSGEEIKKMASEIDNGDSFIWETGTMKSGQITVQYALGYPRDKNALGK